MIYKNIIKKILNLSVFLLSYNTNNYKQEEFAVSKKSADRRKENKKNFRQGLVKRRERFLNKKYALMEDVLSNEKKKEDLLAKEIKDMSEVEKAVAFSLSMRPISLDEFSEKKDEMKKAEIISAKHKFGVK